MLKPFLLATLTLVASGCATSNQIQGPNGKPAFFIKCGSAVLQKCYEKAAEVCPSGYSMLDRDQNGNAIIVPAGNALVMTRGPNSIFVECKA